MNLLPSPNYDNQDYTNLIIFATLGIPVLGTYSTLFNKNKSEIDKLWTNNGSNILRIRPKMRYLYMISIFICMICSLYLIYYLTDEISNKKIFDQDYWNGGRYTIYTALCLMVGFSILWVPFIKNWYICTGVLFIASLGAILLSIKDIDDKDIVAIIFSAYLAFHMFFLDFLIWTGLVLI